jgi:hypothetical protein
MTTVADPSAHSAMATVDPRLLPENRNNHRRNGLLAGDPVNPLL